jgi:hypothetical protein
MTIAPLGLGTLESDRHSDVPDRGRRRYAGLAFNTPICTSMPVKS